MARRFNIAVYDGDNCVAHYGHAYDWQISGAGLLIVFPRKDRKEIFPPTSYTYAEVERVKVKRGSFDGRV